MFSILLVVFSMFSWSPSFGSQISEACVLALSVDQPLAIGTPLLASKFKMGFEEYSDLRRLESTVMVPAERVTTDHQQEGVTNFVSVEGKIFEHRLTVDEIIKPEFLSTTLFVWEVFIHQSGGMQGPKARLFKAFEDVVVLAVEASKVVYFDKNRITSSLTFDRYDPNILLLDGPLAISLHRTPESTIQGNPLDGANGFEPLPIGYFVSGIRRTKE